MKKKTLLLTLPLLSFLLVGCKNNPPKDENNLTQEQSDFYFCAEEKTLSRGETFTFYYYKIEDGKEVRYDFRNWYYKLGKVVYSSDNSDIVSINDEGEAVGVSEGETFIRLRSDIFSFQCKVTVVKEILESIQVTKYKTKYYTGREIKFLCETSASFSNGITKPVTPYIDVSNVNTNKVGNYDVTISYTFEGVTKSQTKTIEMIEGNGYVPTKVKMDYTIEDLEHNSSNPMIPSFGKPKLLVIPVKFRNSNKFIANYENVREDIETVFFGTSEEVGYESVRTFYEKESFNQVSIQGVVSDWYLCDYNSTDIWDYNTVELIHDRALDWYFASSGSDSRTSFDSDGDGLLDGVVFVYGAPNTHDFDYGGHNDYMWAYIAHRAYFVKNVSHPNSAGFMWASYDFLYPTLDKAMERTEKSSYAYYPHIGRQLDSVNYNPIVFLHETGHMFGLNDYYSYTENGVYYAGSANIQTSNYMGHDPYSIMLIGWADPYIPTENTTITLDGFVDSHDFILLKPDTSTVNSPFDEYILVDLYTPTGINKFFAIDEPVTHAGYGRASEYIEPGVRIWHVDARLSNFNLDYKEEFLTTDPTSESAYFIADNSFGRTTNPVFDDFVELEMIRNDTHVTLRDLGFSREEDLFQVGDTFTIDKFEKQFANGNVLDSGEHFDWSIYVDSMFNTGDGYSVDIVLTKI